MLREDINNALKTAMKAQDARRVSTLRLVNSALKNAETWEQYRSNGVNPNGSLNLHGLADEQEWYVANGYMTDRLDLDQVVDYRFLDFALQQLGRYPE